MQETLARIMVQTSRQRNLADVLTDLITFVGSEFYFHNYKQLEGIEFSQVQSRLQVTSHSLAVLLFSVVFSCGNKSLFLS
jgi:hypothetical protein